MLARLKSELAYARGLLSGVARTRVVGAAPTKTLGDYFEEWSLRHGDRPALGSDGESFSYRQLDARANRYARWARGRGLGKGDVVALMMMNRPEYLAIWLGFARAGAAAALINTNLTGPSLAHCISAVKAKAAVVEVPADAGLRNRAAAARGGPRRLLPWRRGDR